MRPSRYLISLIFTGREIVEYKGFSGLSARKVVREIGYTVGTLYNVFDNFTELVCHTNSNTLDDLKLISKAV